MKVQALVDIEIYDKDKDYCDSLCPYMEIAGLHCKCLLSGKATRLRENEDGDTKRSVFCKQHQFIERARSLTFVKSFLSQ
jgi:hypothetical protein